MKKNNGDKNPSYVPKGKKLAITPRKGEPAKKDKTIVEGVKKVSMPNGIYAPKPIAVAKKEVKKTPPKKSNYKAPSNKKVFGTVNKQNKQVKRRGLKKC